MILTMNSSLVQILVNEYSTGIRKSNMRYHFCAPAGLPPDLTAGEAAVEVRDGRKK